MFLKAEGEWVTTTAAVLLPSCCFADSALCVDGRHCFSFICFYSAIPVRAGLTWIPCSSAVFSGRAECTPEPGPTTISGTTRNRMQNLLTTRNFPCSKLFHDSYFSLDVVRLFFSFLFCSRESVTHSESAKGPRFAPSKGPLPAVRLAQAIPNRVLVGPRDSMGPRAH